MSSLPSNIRGLAVNDLPLRQVHCTPSEPAQQLWKWASQLAPGGQHRFDCDTAADAKRLQRWFFRERKRAKRDLIRMTPGVDPDDLDVMKGVVTWLDGSAIVLAMPKPFRAITATLPDGTTVDLTNADPRDGIPAPAAQLIKNRQKRSRK